MINKSVDRKVISAINYYVYIVFFQLMVHISKLNFFHFFFIIKRNLKVAEQALEGFEEKFRLPLTR